MGESVLNRRTPKGNPPKSPAWVQSFTERAFPLAMKNVSIKHLQLFEDRSDAACRVVVKTTGSWGGMRGGHGTRMAVAAMGGLWARCGSQ